MEQRMDSQQWRKQIDTVEAEIRGKELRLAAIAIEKVLVITDNKRLAALEREEASVPAEIEQLRRRLPLLARELEQALKTEAGARLRELEQQGTEAATQTHASRAGIRLAMQSLLDTIREAHGDWGAHALVVAESTYLSVRFGLPHVAIPRAAHLTPEEMHHFKSQFDLLLRHAPNTQPWDGLLRDFQEARRREESQRRAQEDAARPSNPHHIHFTDAMNGRGTPPAPAVVPATHTARDAQPGLLGEKEKVEAELREVLQQAR